MKVNGTEVYDIIVMQCFCNAVVIWNIKGSLDIYINDVVK